MYWDDISTLLAYASERYSPPDVRWKKEKFRKRCYEIYAYESVVTIYMNNPFKDPMDILEEYLIYIEGCISYFKDKPSRKKEYAYMKNAIIGLMTKL